MDNNCIEKMDKFLTSANEILDNLKEEQSLSKKLHSDAVETINKANKTIATVRNVLLIIIIPIIGAFVQVETNLVKKPNAEEVVLKKDAILAHKYNSDNIEKIANVLTNDPKTMDVVRAFNTNYMQTIERIYSK